MSVGAAFLWAAVIAGCIVIIAVAVSLGFIIVRGAVDAMNEGRAKRERERERQDGMIAESADRREPVVNPGSIIISPPVGQIDLPEPKYGERVQ